MSYIEDNLSPNEKILYKASVSGAIFLPAFVCLAGTIAFFVYCIIVASQRSEASGLIAGIILLFSFLFLLLAILYAIKALFIKLTTEFAVTNKRIVAKSGFIRRHTLEIFLSKVESISVSQNILG